jgi:hypothetical protein
MSTCVLRQGPQGYCTSYLLLAEYLMVVFFVHKLIDEVYKYRHLVTVSPSPQSKEEENDKLHELRRYARDFRCQHTTDAKRFNWDSDDEDYGLAIGRLVVT